MSAINDFLRACETGDKDTLDRALQKKVHGVNDVDDSGHTGLQVAAANDQREVVKYLLSRKADVSLANSSGWTPLHHACFHGHTEVCRLLIKANANVKARNKFGGTPLNVAAASGHLSTVKLLLEAGAPIEEDNQAQYANCPVPIATTALYCREAVLRTLLEKKPNTLNIVTAESLWTPLMFTAVVGCKPLAQLLIDRGADPDRLNAMNATAFEVAYACGNSEVRAYLEGKTTVRTQNLGLRIEDEFFSAVRENDLEFVLDLLDKDGIDIDTTDAVGATALMMAAMTGHYEMTKVLLENDAEVDLQDAVNGWTALMQATFFGHRGVTAVLLEAGADPTLAANNGCTALDLATLMEETDTDILRLLAGQTIEMAPPSLSFRPSPGLVSRSHSTPALNEMGKEEKKTGFRAWLGRVSSRFKRLKPEPRKVVNKVSVHVTPSEGNEESMNVENIESHGIEMEGSVFTLGFSAATTNLSSYIVSPLAPPDSRGEKIQSSSMSGNFVIPDGFNTGRPSNVTPKTNKLLSDSGSTKVSNNSDKDAFNHSDSARNVRRRRSHSKPRRKGHQRTRSEPHHIEAGHHRRSNRKKSNEKHKPDVKSVLKDLSLAKYIPIFQEQEIDFAAFKELTDADLSDLGISSQKDKSRILHRIQTLR